LWRLPTHDRFATYVNAHLIDIGLVAGDVTAMKAAKTAHYMARWLTNKGEPGPWSATVSARIGA
jgi:hypothetical protein